jgi:hypothetical protein
VFLPPLIPNNFEMRHFRSRLHLDTAHFRRDSGKTAATVDSCARDFRAILHCSESTSRSRRSPRSLQHRKMQSHFRFFDHHNFLEIRGLPKRRKLLRQTNETELFAQQRKAAQVGIRDLNDLSSSAKTNSRKSSTQTGALTE